MKVPALAEGITEVPAETEIVKSPLVVPSAAVALMTTSPAPLHVTKPFLSTPAILELLLDHVTAVSLTSVGFKVTLN